uniref:fibrous sheath CABYR-binding protein n=1 Tax=Ictidomys tridecemlineatus TaxID=43179 RepID=UPI001A9CBEB7|nr:fibrous sheath CABYR-binding protein [Ictidomys tridecemlineatus]
MEENDVPRQSISVGRQEIRKRRRTSQPMVDKSQQTEGTEKKKHQAVSQSTVPKAIFSIGNIPGSNARYSAKDYERFRVSSQLQQTWAKKKHGQKMTDESLQTETSVEKKKVKSSDRPVGPKKKPAGVGKAGPELPEGVQGVEIIPSQYSIQFKIDRSQQTIYTGDLSMMSLSQVEKVDKEQQTYFAEPKILIISEAGSSFTNSKESIHIYKSLKKIFVSDSPEFQPAISSHGKKRQKNIKRDSFTQETPKDTPLFLADESRQEGSVVKKDASVETEYLPTEEFPAEGALAEVEPRLAGETPTEVQPTIEKNLVSDKMTSTTEITVPPSQVEGPPSLEPGGPAEGQFLPDEEALAEVEPRLAEETPTEVQPTIEKTLVSDKMTSTTEIAVSPSLDEGSPSLESLAKIQPPLVQEVLSEDHFGPGESSLAGVDPSEELPTEIQFPLVEETPAQVQPTVPEDEFGEAPAEVQSAEKAPAPVQPPSVVEAPTEVILEPELATSKEAPKQKPSAKVHSRTAKKSPVEKHSPKVQPLTDEGGFVEEFPAAVQPPANEEAPVEIQSPSFEECPLEEAPAEAQPPPAEESPLKEDLSLDQSPPAKETISKEVQTDIQSPSDGEAFPEEVLAQVQSLLAEEAMLQFHSPPVEEFFPEEVQVRIQPLLAEPVPAEDDPGDQHLSVTDVVPTEEFPGQEMIAKVPPPPSEPTPANGDVN